MRTILSAVAALLIGVGMVHAQQQYPTAEVPTSEPAYLAKVKTAAPEPIVSKATIIMMQEGKPRELQAGSNSFTCLINPTGTPLCADQNAMAWMKSIRERTEPPDTIGFIYMLAGDTGTSNHDPHQRDTHLHWVQTGPHVREHQKAGGDSSVPSRMRFSTGMTWDRRNPHENQGAAHRMCRG
jgi:hypothetical protein